jgi:hypothetical protein
MEGTDDKETEAIQEGDEKFEADQGRNETCGGNQSGYQISTNRHSVSYVYRRGAVSRLVKFPPASNADSRAAKVNL